MSRWQTAVTALHLSAWSQCAVLARFYIVAVFGAACHSRSGSSWLPCVTSPGLRANGGALFLDLPANAFGCFIMGLLAPADVLALAFQMPAIKGAIPLLPAHSPLQDHAPLLVGLRTGFCGSMTTYANWMLQMVQMLVGGAPSEFNTEWVAALAGLFVGQAVAMLALALGQQLSVVMWSRHTSTSKHCTAVEAISPPASTDGTSKTWDVLGPSTLPGDSDSAPELEQPPLQPPPPPPSWCPSGTPKATAIERTPNDGPRTAAGRSDLPSRLPAVWMADLAALLVLCTLTGVSLAYLVLDLRSETFSAGRPRAYVWFATLFAPFGCCLSALMYFWQSPAVMEQRFTVHLVKLSVAFPGPPGAPTLELC